MQINEVMSPEVDFIVPTTTLTEASRIMRDDNVGALPVAEDDKLVGMITDRDIVVRAIAEGMEPGSTSVRDAMSEKVLYCFDDQSPEEVAVNMGENQIRRLPVLNRDKRLVGIVSLGDLSVGGAVGEAGQALESISQAAH